MTLIKEYLEKNKTEFEKWLVHNEQGRIDIKILPYLKDIERGFFVEAGALDGLFMSNTKVLEDLGWNGLLIEPSPKAAKKCRENRKSPIEECALVSTEYPHDKIAGDFFFDGEEGLGAWSSIHRSAHGIKAAMIVKARTLKSIFKQYNIKKIDFLSLDVEGYEPEALEGIDFNEVDIKYLLIEINTGVYSLEEIDKHLAEFGYKNIACLSGFDETLLGWDKQHNDFLYERQ